MAGVPITRCRHCASDVLGGRCASPACVDAAVAPTILVPVLPDLGRPRYYTPRVNDPGYDVLKYTRTQRGARWVWVQGDTRHKPDAGAWVDDLLDYIARVGGRA